MQLIIDITEDEYNEVMHQFNLVGSEIQDSLNGRLKYIIANGTIVSSDNNQNYPDIKMQPYNCPIPNDVIDTISNYFKVHLSQYVPVEIFRCSNHPEDNNLYMVVAKNQDGSFACWTSWNQLSGCLNHGHFGRTNIKACESILKSHFIDITGQNDKNVMEVCKYLFIKDNNCVDIDEENDYEVLDKNKKSLYLDTVFEPDGEISFNELSNKAKKFGKAR